MPFDKDAIKSCVASIQANAYGDSAEFWWSSRSGMDAVGDYLISAYAPAGWFEQVHKQMTCLRLYLPVTQLKGGREKFETILKQFCDLLRPVHGAAGLGIQECREWDVFQHSECETAWDYRGLDVCGPLGDKLWRPGYRSLNWYTYLTQHWLDKLGAAEELKAKLDDERIAVIPYEWGSMIRAGDWPQGQC